MPHMPPERPPQPLAGRVENYTVPFLWAAGVLCFAILFVLWALWGMAVAVGSAVLADRVLPRR